jgi:hypothetical protein
VGQTSGGMPSVVDEMKTVGFPMKRCKILVARTLEGVLKCAGVSLIEGYG